ncbi:DNA-binding IclR family transcriptional regulator [Pseudomonas nitritireducens]|uniref:DNA-binding IclR family transcriptional regulator n=1 Tax=Pseudomonas nitroreducens TaxID=46680 RepID=A0A7W7KL34_PSENT|nr:IclR family transcriptional regulator [Pseudomonas nitritireducens]MBB4864782.1 DNA-binding IclR family transcriptional regulator [Pseudomonas nitritireducens]
MNEPEESAPTKGAKVQSAEVGTQILKALADLAPSTSLKRLGEYLEMPVAKVHRYLQALIASGFAEQDPTTNHYGLGREALYVGLAAIRRLDVVKVASPALAELRDALEQTCFLAIWGSHGPTVVQVEPAQGMVTLVTQVGSVLPLHGSSTGLVFAAYQDGLEQGAEPQVLEGIRAAGLHAVHGLLMPGVNALSVPLFKTGRELAGVITVVGSEVSFAAEPQSEAARALLEVAREVSLRMGGEV